MSDQLKERRELRQDAVKWCIKTMRYWTGVSDAELCRRLRAYRGVMLRPVRLREWANGTRTPQRKKADALLRASVFVVRAARKRQSR